MVGFGEVPWYSSILVIPSRLSHLLKFKKLTSIFHFVGFLIFFQNAYFHFISASLFHNLLIHKCVIPFFKIFLSILKSCQDSFYLFSFCCFLVFFMWYKILICRLILRASIFSLYLCLLTPSSLLCCSFLYTAPVSCPESGLLRTAQGTYLRWVGGSTDPIT